MNGLIRVLLLEKEKRVILKQIILLKMVENIEHLIRLMNLVFYKLQKKTVNIMDIMAQKILEN